MTKVRPARSTAMASHGVSAYAAFGDGGARLTVQGIPVQFAAGLSCDRSGAQDVMRGEETQIFGAHW